MKRDNTRRMAVVGMAAALVFVSNYFRITMPVSVGGTTSFTLANIMCCLSGLLLGPVGGVAAGIGSALYDLTNPLYAPEFFITLFNKGLMGLAAGVVAGSRPGYARCTLASAAGCLVYYVLYFLKTFAKGVLVKQLVPVVAAAALLEKVPASLFNGTVAILLAPPLCIALRRALGNAHSRPLP